MNAEILKVLKDDVNKITQLCQMVNQYSNALGLGNKVHVEDWTEKATDAMRKIEAQNPTPHPS